MGLPDNSIVSIKSKFPKGPRNLITDVPGVRVGHVTLRDSEKDIHTGVTAIIPAEGNLFKEKVAAGVAVINGFGKSAGLVQVKELGTIEAPVALTNTFGVGRAVDALIKYMLEENEDIGVSTGTVNCLAMECNDGELNDIRGMHVREEHVREALDKASDTFEEGDVGAGTGMICMSLKGGIGSSSRVLEFDGREYCLGALVLSNFGVAGNLRIDGVRVPSREGDSPDKDKGSTIIIIGTDIPMDSRQLERTASRASAGLGRVGSFMGTGSGDIAVAFSSGNRISHYAGDFTELKTLSENAIDKVFEAAVEAVEEAVISSLYHSGSVTGIRGKHVDCLKDVFN